MICLASKPETWSDSLQKKFLKLFLSYLSTHSDKFVEVFESFSGLSEYMKFVLTSALPTLFWQILFSTEEYYDFYFILY